MAELSACNACAAGKDLNLAEDFFKLGHLLEAGLLRKRDLIEDAGNAALKEEAIEIRLNSIAGEWSEIMLTFQEYKTRGPVVLKVEFTLRGCYVMMLDDRMS